MAMTGIAQGTYLAVDLALVTDVLPERRPMRPENLGIFNIASVMPQLLMPAVAPRILVASGGSYAPVRRGGDPCRAGCWAILPCGACLGHPAGARG